MVETGEDRGTSSLLPIQLGIVGVGKIARDQHLPAIADSARFKLVAAASRHSAVDGVPSYETIEEMLANAPDIDAISICTPPAGRNVIALAAIEAGKHVMLEKPPGATISEVVVLEHAAENAGVTLFASWHSREAPAVASARSWLADRRVTGGAIIWHEDVRRWHPGQEWILGAGGFGVFDPAINALSIVTSILSGGLAVRDAVLTVPEGRQAPIAAQANLTLDGKAMISLSLEFREEGEQTWEITLDTDSGRVLMSEGGARLAIDGAAMALPPSEGEYPSLYKRFGDLIVRRESDVDLRPLQLVADAFLVAEIEQGPAFHF